jgi:hypothetical protein
VREVSDLVALERLPADGRDEGAEQHGREPPPTLPKKVHLMVADFGVLSGRCASSR